MKKIINGKMYNTETAILLARRDSGYAYYDYRSFEEILYQKNNGEFFLYGTGGAMSRYAETVGGDIRGGENIFPLTEKETKKWAEENLSCEEYEKIFGAVEE